MNPNDCPACSAHDTAMFYPMTRKGTGVCASCYCTNCGAVWTAHWQFIGAEDVEARTPVYNDDEAYEREEGK